MYDTAHKCVNKWDKQKKIEPVRRTKDPCLLKLEMPMYLNRMLTVNIEQLADSKEVAEIQEEI